MCLRSNQLLTNVAIIDNILENNSYSQWLIGLSRSKETVKPVNPFYNGDSKISTLENSEDPDEMPHDAAFYQGLHCKGKKRSSCFLKNITCHP